MDAETETGYPTEVQQSQLSWQVDFWKNLDLSCQIFEPALQALRVSDSMKADTPDVL
jgi:hypothetical protein